MLFLKETEVKWFLTFGTVYALKPPFAVLCWVKPRNDKAALSTNQSSIIFKYLFSRALKYTMLHGIVLGQRQE